jgi:outer membrane protein assembly factor BamD
MNWVVLHSGASAPSSRASRLARVGAALFSIVFALAGCSVFEEFNPFGAEKYKTIIEPDIPASKVYDQGLAKLANGAPQDAATKFINLGKQYPGSDWARKGLLMTTYAQFTAGDYDGAAISGDRYVKEYPKTPEAAYALYMQASSYYAQILDISRDQERAQKALDLFKKLVQDYPKSEYVEDSKFKIDVAMDQLGGKEMSIGRFYLNRRNYTAAINRFRNVLTNYQTTRHSEEALYRLVEAYLGLGITDEAQTAAAVLGHNFPDGEWYKNAYALLKGGGLEPHENQQSWISKIYHSVVPS